MDMEKVIKALIVSDKLEDPSKETLMKDYLPSNGSSMWFLPSFG
jgi:hypothetical protein